MILLPTFLFPLLTLDAAVNSLILDTQFVFLTVIQNILREKRTFIKSFITVIVYQQYTHVIFGSKIRM